jgi:hypothetical protein
MLKRRLDDCLNAGSRPVAAGQDADCGHEIRVGAARVKTHHDSQKNLRPARTELLTVLPLA